MHKHLRILALSLALFAAAPGAADAAVLTVEGGTLVFRADAGEENVPALYPGRYGGINIDDLNGHPIRVEGANCQGANGGLECGTPSQLRLELGDADDRVDWATTFPSSVRVEIRGEAGNDRLKANEYSANKVVLDGGDGDDLLDGFGQADVLRGGAGNDTLNGSAGDDVLEGGDGDDLLRPDGSTSSPGRDVVDGGGGFDVVRDWANQSAATHAPVSVTADGVANDGRPGENDNVIAVEGVVSAVSGTFAMSDADEEVLVEAYLDEQPSTVDGRGGNDLLEGFNAQETLDGGAGDDVVEGGWNHDTLTGGPGKDVIYGDDTDPQCGGNGQSCVVPFGNDTIHARDGEVDQVDCGVGADTAVVDAIDVVSGCETVDAAAAPVATPAPAPAPLQGPAAPVAPRRVAATVRRVGLRAALRRGLTVTVSDAQPGRSRAVLVRGGREVAAGTLKVGADGRGRATLRFTRAAKRSFAGVRSVRLTLRAAGAERALRLKR